MNEVNALLRDEAARFAKVLERYLPTGEDLVAEAVRYSMAEGGKRIRPILVKKFHELFGGAPGQADAFAVAVEMIHTYSLIHDDLPCMDDDDYRRGRLSCHRKFGERAALLAGDALLAQAFAVIAGAGECPPLMRCRATALLAQAAGNDGMVGGQWLDLCYENREISRTQLEEMNRRKTGALLCAACGLGCLAAGADEAQTAAALGYADALGLLFQLTDDILDVTAVPETLGKTVGKDAAAGKSTWVSLLRLGRAQEAAKGFAVLARQEIAPYAGEDALLFRLPEWILKRER